MKDSMLEQKSEPKDPKDQAIIVRTKDLKKSYQMGTNIIVYSLTH